MKKEIRKIQYDDTLQVEACYFSGIAQPFPNHFHEYYVIGLMENGKRQLSCKNKTYTIEDGVILLFNPKDNHACVQSDGDTMTYYGLHIPKESMLALTEKITGRRELPYFSEPVIKDMEIQSLLRTLHEMLQNDTSALGREEQLLFLLSALIRKYGQPFADNTEECRQEIKHACAFMEQHFKERLSLEEICRCAALSKSTLLRSFTREKGITPYRYLENIRINQAKALLQKGVSPLDAAMQTGFSDQSHFTNYFNCFIGLTPAVYREIFSEKNKRGEKHEK